MMKLDLMNVMKAADDLLDVTENPRHRAILQNYRSHALLEIAGRWEEILTPEFMVASPSYRITEKGQTLVMNGMEEVAVFYRQIAEAGLTVFGPMEEELAVWDWGFASESHFAHIMPGHALAAQGEDIDDPDAHYFLTHYYAMFWPYDEECKLIGERVYEDTGSREITKMDPAEVITPQQAREMLAPLIDRAVVA